MSDTDLQQWQRPPFEEGNTAALKHGAYSERFLGPEREALVTEAFEACPWLQQPAYGPAVRSWAQLEASLARVLEYLANNGELDAKGRPRPAMELAIRLRKQVESARGRLGLDPTSRARLGRDISASRADLARAWALEAAQDGETPDGTTDPDSGQEAHRERP